MPNKLTQQCTECITLFHNPSVRHSQHTYVRAYMLRGMFRLALIEALCTCVISTCLPTPHVCMWALQSCIHTQFAVCGPLNKVRAQGCGMYVRTYVRSHIVNYVRSFLHVRAYARTYVGTYVCFLSRTVCHIAAAAEMVATCLRLTYVRACRNQLLSQRKYVRTYVLMHRLHLLRCQPSRSRHRRSHPSPTRLLHLA